MPKRRLLRNATTRHIHPRQLIWLCMRGKRQCRLLAHRDKPQSPEFTVGIDAKPDICGQAVSAEFAANDPDRTSEVIHSPLMFAALMIGHHFSISALW